MSSTASKIGYLTPLYGRQHETAVGLELLGNADVRLLTISGPGGIGKTRFAHHLVEQAQDLHFTRTTMVDLSPVTDPTLVLFTIADTCSIRVERPAAILDRLTHYLSRQPTLLMLDNFEQVVNAADQILDLLHACPTLKIIVTSRALLQIIGEHVLTLAPLSVPDLRRTPLVGDDLAQMLAGTPAVSLFLERMQAVTIEHTPSVEEVIAVAKICALLDGIPLAIELAAARTYILSPTSLLAQLSEAQGRKSLTLLRSNNRNLAERHQTMEHTLRWSYALLSSEEQNLYRALAIFAGSFSLQAVEALISIRGLPINALDGITALVENSLLLRMRQTVDEVRFRILVPLREFGVAALDDAHESEAVHQAHAQYYLTLAQAVEIDIRGSAQQHALAILLADQDNFRAALTWSLDQRNLGLAMRLCRALCPIWLRQFYLSEAIQWIARTIECVAAIYDIGDQTQIQATSPRELPTEYRFLFAELLSEAVPIATLLGDRRASSWAMLSREHFTHLQHPEGITRAQMRLARIGHHASTQEVDTLLDCLSFYTNSGNQHRIAECLHGLARIAWARSEFGAGEQYIARAVRIRKNLGDIWEYGHSLYLATNIALCDQRYNEVASLAEQSEAAFAASNFDVAFCSGLRAWASLNLGDIRAAEQLFHQSILHDVQIGSLRSAVHSQLGLAKIAHIRNDIPSATHLLEAAYDIAFDTHMPVQLADLLDLWATLKVETAPQMAAQMLGAAATLRKTTHVAASTFLLTDVNETLARVQQILTPADFAEAWHGGAERWLPDVGKAFDIPPPPDQTVLKTLHTALEVPRVGPNQSAYVPPLTERERDVLSLVAQGMTNAEVAETLVVSIRTVHAHLRNIYDKLNVTSRTAATRYALDNQILSTGATNSSMTSHPNKSDGSDE